jgi:hypothetical protein
MVNKAESVLAEDIQSLKKESPERLRRLWNEITDYQDTYKWDDEWQREFELQLEGRDRQRDRRTFRAALLYLDAASVESRRAERVGNFTDDEIEFVREFDDFRVFDSVDASQIKSDIVDQEGEIYEFVNERVADLVGQRGDLLNTWENQIEGDVVDYFSNQIDEYERKSNQAVSIYIQEHGLPNAVEGIVAAAEATASATATREDVVDRVEEQLAEATNRLDRDLRERDRRLQARLTELESEVVDRSVDAGDLDDALTEIRSELRSRDRRGSDAASELAARIDEIEELKSELTAEIDELQAVKEETKQDADESEDVATLIEDELSNLREQQAAIESEVSRLRATREQRSESQKRVEERVEELEASLGGDEPAAESEEAVTAAVARLYELDYVSRFDRSVRDARTITLPDGSRYEPSPDLWDETGVRTSDRRQVEEALAGTGETADSYPVALRSRYAVTDSRLFGAFNSTELVVEVVSKPHLTAYATNGFDARPAGVPDLLDVVNQAISAVESQDVTHLIGVASPTGWSDRVRSLIEADDFARSRFDVDLSLCLVDARTGELTYDESDPLVRENVELFEYEVDPERFREGDQVVRNQYVDDPSKTQATITEVVEDHDIEPRVVRAVFERLAEEGVAEIDTLPDVGLYIYDV